MPERPTETPRGSLQGRGQPPVATEVGSRTWESVGSCQALAGRKPGPAQGERAAGGMVAWEHREALIGHVERAEEQGGARHSGVARVTTGERPQY